MLCALRCMFNWARTWNIISIITSCIWLAIYNWSCHSSGWINVVILLKGVGKNDYCCKKGSQIFTWICKTYIWDKRLIHMIKF